MFGLQIYSVVVKKNNKWLVGNFKDNKFVEKKQIKKLGDVKGVAEYTTLKKFLKESNKDNKLEKQILEQTGLDKIYVLDKPYDPTEEEWDDYWWSEHNHVCKSCQLSCKQSYKTTIYKCSRFEKKIKTNGRKNGKT